MDDPEGRWLWVLLACCAGVALLSALSGFLAVLAAEGLRGDNSRLRRDLDRALARESERRWRRKRGQAPREHSPE